MKYINIKETLKDSIDSSPERISCFFKTDIGEYAEHDKFIGIRTPTLRQIAKCYQDLPLNELQYLLDSEFNEERLLALFILILKYKSNIEERESIYKFYIKNLHNINNWNLVDSSSHLIVGQHLLDKDKSILIELSKSEVLWERRISIVSTWYFIRHLDFEYTLKISFNLLNDKHDLIHKAVGWMLREVGKKNKLELINFLDKYFTKMPRTMLRYAIERFDINERKKYLSIK